MIARPDPSSLGDDAAPQSFVAIVRRSSATVILSISSHGGGTPVEIPIAAALPLYDALNAVLAAQPSAPPRGG